jgi:hypothetical protein
MTPPRPRQEPLPSSSCRQGHPSISIAATKEMKTSLFKRCAIRHVASARCPIPTCKLNPKSIHSFFLHPRIVLVDDGHNLCIAVGPLLSARFRVHTQYVPAWKIPEEDNIHRRIVAAPLSQILHGGDSNCGCIIQRWVHRIHHAAKVRFTGQLCSAAHHMHMHTRVRRRLLLLSFQKRRGGTRAQGRAPGDGIH